VAALSASRLTWQAIQQRGVWRVGLDPSFPPFECWMRNNAPAGYDVDLAHALAATWGVRAEIVPVGFDSLPDTLKTGKIDSHRERLSRMTNA
jgi:polar amino acid transport system substrate-binding protein